MSRKSPARRLLGRLPWWLKLLVAAVTPLCALNLAVAFFGESLVFPLSPFFLKEKWTALARYARHRPTCLLSGHGDLTALAAAAGARHRLPPGLLESLVEVESEGKVHRISAAGAMGPGQLTDGTARMLGVEDPYEPAAALDASARYLAAQLRRFGDVRLALAAYNAGPGSVRGSVPRNGETEFYVEKVMAALAARSAAGRPTSNPSPSRAQVAVEPAPKAPAITAASTPASAPAASGEAASRPGERPASPTRPTVGGANPKASPGATRKSSTPSAGQRASGKGAERRGTPMLDPKPQKGNRRAP